MGGGGGGGGGGVKVRYSHMVWQRGQGCFKGLMP